MKHESAVQAVKELMRKDSVFRSVIQGWGVATLLIGIFMFYICLLYTSDAADE